MPNFVVDKFIEINKRNLDIWKNILDFLIPPANAPGIPPGTPPPTVIPQPDDQPDICPPPRVIYIPSGNGARPSVDIKVNPPPSVPPRRLPKEADGQSPTKTKKKHSISIKAALYDEIHGELLTFPLTQKKAVYTRYELDGFAEKMKATLEFGANAFGIWLAHERGDEVDEGTAKPTLFDGTALVTPSNLAGLSGEVGLIYGLAPLTTLASAYQVSRINARQPVTGYVPLVIEFNSKSIPDSTPSFLGSSDFIFSGDLADIKRVLGVDEFPVTVPRSLVHHTDEELDKILDQKIKLMQTELGNISDKKLKESMQDAITEARKQKSGKSVYQALKNIPQQISWTVKALDEVLGSFPVSITLTDSDLIKVGDQEQNIRLPNIAEALAELQGLSILNHASNELAVNMLVRILLETGMGRQQTIKNYYLLDVIRDYLGCATKEVTKDVQFTYDPLFDLGKDDKDEFAKFMTPAQVKVDIEEIDEKHSLQRAILKVDQIYALCRAYMTRPLKDTDSIVKYVKEIAKGIGVGDEPDDPDKKDDFDLFLEKVEQGFIAENGNTLGNKPFGREFEQRPRITRLTKQNDAQD